jgi:hypothetical protein
LLYINKNLASYQKIHKKKKKKKPKVKGSQTIGNETVIFFSKIEMKTWY